MLINRFQWVTVKKWLYVDFITNEFIKVFEIVIENKLKKNQSIEVKYFEQEFYDPKTKDYKYYKVLDYLEIK